MHKRIMIAVNEGSLARCALDEGLGFAKDCGAEVLFFHVLPNYVMPVVDAPALVYLSPEQHREEVEREAARILAACAERASQLGVSSSGSVGSGADTAECIADAARAKGCDLIVIGSHGRTAIQRLILGSVVTRLIPLATMPVLVCKRPLDDEDQPVEVEPLVQHQEGLQPGAAPH